MLPEGALASFLNSALGFSPTLFLGLPRTNIFSHTTMGFRWYIVPFQGEEYHYQIRFDQKIFFSNLYIRPAENQLNLYASLIYIRILDKLSSANIILSRRAVPFL